MRTQSTQRVGAASTFSGIMYYEYDVYKKQYVVMENTKSVLGYEAEELQELLIGNIQQGDGYGLTHPEDRSVILSAHETLLHEGESKAEYRFCCKSGVHHWFSVTIDYLSTQIQLDPMTGLLNKVTAYSMIQEELERNPNGKHALLFFDIDKFKSINDIYGHNEGDEAIKCVAGTIRNLFRKRDIVARFGGDEFVAFLRNIASEQDIIRRVRGINKILQESTWVRQRKVNLSVSIGIAFSDKDITVKELFEHADQAVYAAKKDQITHFGVYSKEGEKAETPMCFGLPDRYAFFDQVDHLLANLSGQYCFVYGGLKGVTIHGRFGYLEADTSLLVTSHNYNYTL